MKKFPEMIHVYIENEDQDEPFLSVAEDGVTSVEENGKRIAIYKLEKVGKVEIQKRFVKP